MTSNSALQQVKRLYQAQKAGHTGSLDPLATGVLPLCFGEATKVSHYLLDSDKTYIARCELGSVTTTGDSDGEVIATEPVPVVDKQQLLKLLASFTGSQLQTPPMFSALKHNGRPLYEYARKGITIEREARPVNIFDIKLVNFSCTSAESEQQFIEIEVHCSKGTYIRTLCEDIGQKLGCGAYISSLRRIHSGPFSLSQSYTLEQLVALSESDANNIDKLLLDTDTAIKTLPKIILNEAQFDTISHGNNIINESVTTTSSQNDFRLYYNDKLLALAVLNKEGLLQPKRLLFL